MLQGNHNNLQIHHQWSIHKFRTTIALILILAFLAGCSGNTQLIGNKFSLGTFWDTAALDGGFANFDNASSVATEQHNGFVSASESLKSTKFEEIAYSEGDQQDDIQVAIRELVENDGIVALVGATSNEATMRSASLANFFNVPMIIPSADGELVIPSTNLWAFRLSAPSTAYADYLFTEILGNPALENRVDPARLKIAILYEENTFGESAAVATATAAMAQSIEIGLYDKFPANSPASTKFSTLAKNVIAEKVDLIYLVSNDPTTAIKLINSLLAQSGDTPLPIIIGQAGGFASKEFMDSDVADYVYLLRQKINTDSCPNTIESLYEAQTYAAISLLDSAIQTAKQKALTQANTSFLQNLRPNTTTTPIVSFRETVRDVLKETNQTVPCLGQVAFDNSGQNKDLEFEFVVTANGSSSIYSVDQFLIDIKAYIQASSSNGDATIISP
ncbi:ABC transporter substrate-binding protein [bacterium]|nr:ABC transporter substrate-binding protein [bacterium]